MRIRSRKTFHLAVAALAAVAAVGVVNAATPSTAQAAGSSFPSAKGTPQPVSKSIEVGKSLDGGMKRYYGSGKLGGDNQKEGQDPLFVLSDGATLSNVVIGSPAADGVHCLGTCTLSNVWWEDVGEDAATFKGSKSSQTMTISGGGARKASDKVFQHNGPGTMHIKNFQVDDFGKLYRSCGNCKTQHKRNVIIENVTAYAPGKSMVGINTNYGDTAKITKLTVVGDSKKKLSVCDKYTGTTKGEPKKTGSGPDGKHCQYSTSDVTYK
ncbi:pectate lyase [Actinosynnema mirum]|uniref:Pectate lyase n=1 Tax=Actinosynnema mirum (strain ATCC 29888 / DSM 43827 / JCM 3225 / NBRC 14064 / NCIMB 13271 / NRRL B-12336 / IMRU 3971 / 101) TaxID=446462 RepID=C6WMH9_ACTMD|nr:pectate lyase [Actinosynnema mirum]ACU36508.1 Pectate lyase [Actinosynnema mirum DSM 43827]